VSGRNTTTRTLKETKPGQEIALESAHMSLIAHATNRKVDSEKRMPLIVAINTVIFATATSILSDQKPNKNWILI
jgi:hypothetical protein